MYVLYTEYVRIEVLALESYRLIEPTVHVGNIFGIIYGLCWCLSSSDAIRFSIHRFSWRCLRLIS